MSSTPRVMRSISVKTVFEDIHTDYLQSGIVETEDFLHFLKILTSCCSIEKLVGFSFQTTWEDLIDVHFRFLLISFTTHPLHHKHGNSCFANLTKLFCEFPLSKI